METLRKVICCVSFYHNTHTDLSQTGIREPILVISFQRSKEVIKKNLFKSKLVHILVESYGAGSSAVVSE